MPTSTRTRGKRTLADADPNVSVTNSTKKRATTKGRSVRNGSKRDEEPEASGKQTKAPQKTGESGKNVTVSQKETENHENCEPVHKAKKKLSKPTTAKNPAKNSAKNSSKNPSKEMASREQNTEASTPEEQGQQVGENSGAASNLDLKGAYGPGNVLILPSFIPLEVYEQVYDAKLAPPSITQVDGTPGRVLSIADEQWRQKKSRVDHQKSQGTQYEEDSVDRNRRKDTRDEW